MDNNITDKISELINSPGGMEKIRAAASALLGSQENHGDEPKHEESLNQNNIADIIGSLTGSINNNDNGAVSEDVSGLMNNAAMMGSIMKVMTAVNSMKTDSRIELIRSLKPYLSEERAKRAEKAISFLKISAVFPLIKEEGLLNIF